MGWQSHHCIVTAGNAFDFRHAKPFLNTVCASFVERFIIFNIEIDFSIRQIICFYVGNIGLGNAFL